MKGKQIGGPVHWYPHGFIWGGHVWTFFGPWSYVIKLPQVVIDFMLMIGVDPYDG